jgi:hypothetical protein
MRRGASVTKDNLIQALEKILGTKTVHTMIDGRFSIPTIMRIAAVQVLVDDTCDMPEARVLREACRRLNDNRPLFDAEQLRFDVDG